MAAPPPHRTLRAPGMGADAAASTVRRVLADVDGLHATPLDAHRTSVSVTRRPPWATTAAVATIWLAGLGLLFLLVRRTDAGEVVVTDGPQGAVVVLPPLLAGGPADAVARALQGVDPRPPPPPRPTVATTGDAAPDERTVARRAPDPRPPPPTDRTLARRRPDPRPPPPVTTGHGPGDGGVDDRTTPRPDPRPPPPVRPTSADGLDEATTDRGGAGPDPRSGP